MLFDFGVNRKQFDFTDMEIDVFDNDVVDLKNLLHQKYEESDLNRSKVEVLSERYAVNGINRFFTEEDMDKYDLIFCCVDSMEFRVKLYKHGFEQGKSNGPYWIDGRCESTAGAVYHKGVGKSKLEASLNDSKERNGCLLKYEKENNISNTTPQTVASIMVQMFLNYIRDKLLPAAQTFIV